MHRIKSIFLIHLHFSSSGSHNKLCGLYLQNRGLVCDSHVHFFFKKNLLHSLSKIVWYNEKEKKNRRLYKSPMRVSQSIHCRYILNSFTQKPRWRREHYLIHQLLNIQKLVGENNIMKQVLYQSHNKWMPTQQFSNTIIFPPYPPKYILHLVFFIRNKKHKLSRSRKHLENNYFHLLVILITLNSTNSLPFSILSLINKDTNEI